jgi:acetate kinase
MAVFDTAFHQTIPVAHKYAILNKFLTENNIRVYGFMEQVINTFQKERENT